MIGFMMAAIRARRGMIVDAIIVPLALITLMIVIDKTWNINTIHSDSAGDNNGNSLVSTRVV